jgi:hypothetical protein
MPSLCKEYFYNDDLTPMLNEKNKHMRCQSKCPYWNYPETSKFAYCPKHKKTGMVSNKDRCTIIEETTGIRCITQASFGADGTKERKYCFKHGQFFNAVNTKARKCITRGCKTQATFNKEGETIGLYCQKHGKDLGFICVTSNKCKHDDCKIQASFGFLDIGKPIACAKHAKDELGNFIDGMGDVVHKKCEHTFTDKNGTIIRCGVFPCFNIPTEITGRWCFNHRSDAGINILTYNVMKKECVADNCTITPYYNKKGETKGLFCKKHGESLGMIDVVSIKCIVIDKNGNTCGIQAGFNIEGQPPAYCYDHSNKTTMINVKHLGQICKIKTCKTRAGFNIIGKKAIVCKKHVNLIYKVEKDVVLCASCCIKINKDTIQQNIPMCETCCNSIINVIKPHCTGENCTTKPIFNKEGETKGLFCAKHKDDDMINVLDKRCKKCNMLARYNIGIDDEKNFKPLYCFIHASDDMHDVKRNTCNVDNCFTRPYYNFPEEKKGICCAKHGKDLGMTDTRNNICQIKDCKEKALYGKQGKRQQYCSNHHDVEPNLINLYLENKCENKECKKEYEYFLNNKKLCSSCIPKKELATIKRLCRYCDIREDIDYICKECNLRGHLKEWQVVRHIKQNISTTFIHDSCKMLNGLSKKRPDLYFELEKHCVIVEVDENQHKAYEDICECSRMVDIVQAVNIKHMDKPKTIVFIRFNPDVIKNKNKKVEISMVNRFNTLIKILNTELNNKYNKFEVKLIQLYFDDTYEKYEPCKIETITEKVTFKKHYTNTNTNTIDTTMTYKNNNKPKPSKIGTYKYINGKRVKEI